VLAAIFTLVETQLPISQTHSTSNRSKTSGVSSKALEIEGSGGSIVKFWRRKEALEAVKGSEGGSKVWRSKALEKRSRRLWMEVVEGLRRRE